MEHIKLILQHIVVLTKSSWELKYQET